jgi:large subunit ribosomal protein L29
MASQNVLKMKDLKNLSATELVTKARGIEADLFQTKMKKVTGQLTDSATLWRMRKELARVKTLHSQSASKGKK